MREKWFPKLVQQSSRVKKLSQSIGSLPDEAQHALDSLMVAMFGEIPSVQVLPVAGYSPHGFHVKYGPSRAATEYDVCMMIIPMTTKGLRVCVRRNLGEGWIKINESGQRLWQKSISGATDVEAIIAYCRDSCGY